MLVQVLTLSAFCRLILCSLTLVSMTCNRVFLQLASMVENLCSMSFNLFSMLTIGHTCMIRMDYLSSSIVCFGDTKTSCSPWSNCCHLIWSRSCYRRPRFQVLRMLD